MNKTHSHINSRTNLHISEKGNISDKYKLQNDLALYLETQYPKLTREKRLKQSKKSIARLKNTLKNLHINEKQYIIDLAIYFYGDVILFLIDIQVNSIKKFKIIVNNLRKIEK